MAVIRYTRAQSFCGGTVITADWIVTASHCMYYADGTPKDVNEIRVVLGEHDNSFSGEETIPRIVREVSEIIIHPEYNTSILINDIALIKVAQAIDLSVYTPACLPVDGTSFVGKMAWVYG